MNKALIIKLFLYNKTYFYLDKVTVIVQTAQRSKKKDILKISKE